MIPFFPSLRPTVVSSICIDADTPCDEEAELREMEKEHIAWVKTIFSHKYRESLKCYFVFEEKKKILFGKLVEIIPFLFVYSVCIFEFK